jgi:hypothetical protein
MGVSRSTIHRWLRSESEMSPENMRKLISLADGDVSASDALHTSRRKERAA